MHRESSSSRSRSHERETPARIPSCVMTRDEGRRDDGLSGFTKGKPWKEGSHRMSPRASEEPARKSVLSRREIVARGSRAIKSKTESMPPRGQGQGRGCLNRAGIHGIPPSISSRKLDRNERVEACEFRSRKVQPFGVSARRGRNASMRESLRDAKFSRFTAS